jgi:hypothetical protein
MEISLVYFIKEVLMGNLRHEHGAQSLIPSNSFDIPHLVAGLCAGSTFIQKGEEKKCAN